MLQIFSLRNTLSFDAISFCKHYKIRTCDVNKRITLIIEQLLPLTNHSKKIIIKDDNFYINIALHNCSEFLQRHLKTTIAYNGNDYAIFCAELCANRRRQSEAHGS